AWPPSPPRGRAPTRCRGGRTPRSLGSSRAVVLDAPERRAARASGLVLDGGRLAAPGAEPEHRAAGRPLLLARAAVRADQVGIPLGVEGHTPPLRAGPARHAELPRDA